MALFDSVWVELSGAVNWIAAPDLFAYSEIVFTVPFAGKAADVVPFTDILYVFAPAPSMLNVPNTLLAGVLEL